MSRRYALGQALRRSGRLATRRVTVAVEQHLSFAGRAFNSASDITESYARRTAQHAMRDLDADLITRLLASRQRSRIEANAALAGVAVGVAVRSHLQGDQERSREFAESLAVDIKAVVAGTVVTWFLSGGRRDLTRALHTDRSIRNLVARTALTESAHAFNDQLDAIRLRNGANLNWLWDAHLESCPVCRARHGRPIAVVGVPPAHPRCQCFQSPFLVTKPEARRR